MDDCNIITNMTDHTIRYVQIPLWTIVTMVSVILVSDSSSSDSSMDDCNELRRKGLPVIDCSDSSMDDCNDPPVGQPAKQFVFRFLYGRL